MAKLTSVLWHDMLDYLRRQHLSICRQWFENLEPIELNSGLLKISVPNRVQKNYLQHKCRDEFTEAAQSATGALVAVCFVTGEQDLYSRQDPAITFADANGGRGSKGQTIETARTATSSKSNRHYQENDFDQILISPDYCFENFVCGPANRLAYAATLAVANHPGQTYNPLFIHGGVGLGKTHLLQAACQKIMQTNPNIRVSYLSCDAFMNQFIESVQKGTMPQFRHRYRQTDVLVLDDIHFLAKRERSQEEFFHTFNALYHANRQIVLSSDASPSEIPQLEQRLISRFQWGLVANVTQPCFETRIAIIRSKAALRGIEIPDDVVHYIATMFESNARELEGAFTNVHGHAALQNRCVDLELAREVLGDTGFSNEPMQVTLQNIIDTVTTFYSVKLSDLQSKRRYKSITQPRQVCMWLARRHTRFSLEEVGRYFGGRDHTTVMHSIRTVDHRINHESNFAREIDQLQQHIDDGQR